jgi:hypothetical protein
MCVYVLLAVGLLLAAERQAPSNTRVEDVVYHDAPKDAESLWYTNGR